ncbi:MAG: hypothetical protein AB8B64_23580 [Granulosicoccus sp.]
MQREFSLSTEQLSKLLHDIRAPVSNARGFKNELNDSIKLLSELIDNIGSELSDENRKRLNDVITDDIIVCSELLATSVDHLQERVLEFDQLLRQKHN